MLIPDNTDTALSILADYHEDNGNYQLADELRDGLDAPRNDWSYEFCFALTNVLSVGGGCVVAIGSILFHVGSLGGNDTARSENARSFVGGVNHDLGIDVGTVGIEGVAW